MNAKLEILECKSYFYQIYNACKFNRHNFYIQSLV